VNLTGYLIAAQAFGPGMIKAGRGSIIHIASIAGTNTQPRSGAYSASKAGVLQLSKQLAVEWGPRGVRSNAILPGLIRTPLSAAFYENKEFEEKRKALVPARRIGEPDDIAQAALFLASDRAAYVNGAEILVDGGLNTVLMEMVPRPGY
jgi:NAD(P)-dependent dehydrogenase (short-subunit alcohol dehydrogenase family)